MSLRRQRWAATHLGKRGPATRLARSTWSICCARRALPFAGLRCRRSWTMRCGKRRPYVRVRWSARSTRIRHSSFPLANISRNEAMRHIAWRVAVLPVAEQTARRSCCDAEPSQTKRAWGALSKLRICPGGPWKQRRERHRHEVVRRNRRRQQEDGQGKQGCTEQDGKGRRAAQEAHQGPWQRFASECHTGRRSTGHSGRRCLQAASFSTSMNTRNPGGT